MLGHEFYLAAKLGRTVAELRETMSNEEFVMWTRYHGVIAQTRDLQTRAATARAGG